MKPTPASVEGVSQIVGIGGLDALAVSVGNVHLAEERASEIDCEALAAIQVETRVPLVLHGGSCIPVAMRQRLVWRDYRIEILGATAPALKGAASEALNALWRPWPTKAATSPAR